MPRIDRSRSKVRTALLAGLVGCVGILVAASDVAERAGFAPFHDVADGRGPSGGQEPVDVPPPADADSWIAFTGVAEDGSTTWYVVDPESSGLRKVRPDAAVGARREWAADGGSIVPCTRPDQAGATPDGCLDEPSASPYLRTPPSLTYLDSRPRRSPDGRTLAFVRIHDAESDRAALMTVAVLSGVAEEVVGFEANVRLGIDWSPDGRLLAYTANPGGGPSTDLWVVAADGSDSRQLTRLPAGHTASSPTFSPDGTRIAICVEGDGWSAIAVVGLDGADPATVVGFGNLMPRDLDWGPVVRRR